MREWNPGLLAYVVVLTRESMETWSFNDEGEHRRIGAENKEIMLEV